MIAVKDSASKSLICSGQTVVANTTSMKQWILILICITSLTSWGQEYELNYKEWDSISPYEYLLTLEYPNEPNEVTLVSRSLRGEFLTIEGKITDYQDSSIQVLIQSLSPLDSSTLELFIPDTNGHFSLSFKSMTVLLRFSYQNQLKTQYLLIESENYVHLTYSLKLGRQQPFEHFLIHSKRELTEGEIKETLECIQINHFYNPDKAWDCDHGKDFFIGMSGG